MKNNLYKILMIITAAVFTSAFLPACSSSKNENSSEKFNSALSLPPGTVNVTGEITSAEEHDKLFSCGVNIKKVSRYGAGAPLLNINDKLIVRVNKSLLKEYEIKPGGTFKLLIKHIPSAGQTNDYWETLEIKK